MYNCFKCKEHLTGICAALEPFGQWTLCLPCLYKFAIVYDSEELLYLNNQGPFPGWTKHHRQRGKNLYHTYPRTMLEIHRYLDKDGWEIKKTRYCSTCKKDCGLGQKDLVLFYCAKQWREKPSDLLIMQCDTCFTKEVGMWIAAKASTSNGGNVNRDDPGVYLYSSPEVIEMYNWD